MAVAERETWFAAAGGAETLGGKGAALAELGRAGFPVPEWFAISPEAFYASISPERRKQLERGDAATALEGLALDSAVEEALHLELRRHFRMGVKLAVRSSAADEDGAHRSFAGQLESFLNVDAADVPAAVVKVWRSGFSPRVLAYRRENRLPGAGRAPAVLVQRMIDAQAAGVAFGADPVSGRRAVCVVSAVRGLGSALVSGDVDADTFRVDRAGVVLEKTLASAGAPSLSDAQAAQVAELARAAGRHFGTPQDVEWALWGGELQVLQSRPITALAGRPDPDGQLNLWDNSNIAESYNGVTTPLTFSFARKAYEEVYQQFCRVMGVPEARIAANVAGTFRRMLGLVRGRVYYNLISWYRVLSLLPGFSVNRKFMEQMMGVKQGIPESVLAEIEAEGRVSKFRDALDLVGTFTGSIRNYRALGRSRAEFYARVNAALETPKVPFADMSLDELARVYRRMEKDLLTRWDAPLVNDFFAMIFYGLLRQKCEAWCGEPNLQNDLLCGEGGLISAEPAKRVQRMADLARPRPDLVDALCGADAERVKALAAEVPALEKMLREYVSEFGERCLEELKLETKTLADEPAVLWRAIGQLARRASPAPKSGLELELRRRAEERAAKALSSKPLKAALFGWILRQTRERVRDRENLRFERTRVFGRARLIFVEAGKRLHALGLLDDPRDVFYLTVEELFGLLDATTTTNDLKGLVRLRQTEFTRYRTGPAPADRFETRGIVGHANDLSPAPAPPQSGSVDMLRGLGACPGVVTAKARVILDPRQATLEPGEILVAPRTDPGWILLFPSAAAIVVEYGSLLSHSAIVARELGVPAVVSVSGLSKWAKTGDWLEVDGAAGTIRRVPAPGRPA
ncbi:MAG: phosphoenolpyruvate synthase [Elusimicrobia bacterium]|nr:phosphoenolpyruvate synthase [Elusimicrobiota bacterium]